MIISHKHRFIFIRTRRTAGTSVEISLSRYCGPQDILSPLFPADEAIRRDLAIYPRHYAYWPANLLVGTGVNLHKFPLRAGRAIAGLGLRRFAPFMTARQIRSRVGGRVWDSYLKFAIERDPLERLVSLYYGELAAGRVRTMDQFLARRPLASTFDAYAIDGDVAVDHLLRFDRLQQDLSAVCAEVGIEFDGWLPGPHPVNRRNRRTWRDLLDLEQQDRVCRALAREGQMLSRLGAPVAEELLAAYEPDAEPSDPSEGAAEKVETPAISEPEPAQPEILATPDEAPEPPIGRGDEPVEALETEVKSDPEPAPVPALEEPPMQVLTAEPAEAEEPLMVADDQDALVEEVAFDPEPEEIDDPVEDDEPVAAVEVEASPDPGPNPGPDPGTEDDEPLFIIEDDLALIDDELDEPEAAAAKAGDRKDLVRPQTNRDVLARPEPSPEKVVSESALDDDPFLGDEETDLFASDDLSWDFSKDLREQARRAAEQVPEPPTGTFNFAVPGGGIPSAAPPSVAPPPVQRPSPRPSPAPSLPTISAIQGAATVAIPQPALAVPSNPFMATPAASQPGTLTPSGSPPQAAKPVPAKPEPEKPRVQSTALATSPAPDLAREALFEKARELIQQRMASDPTFKAALRHEIEGALRSALAELLGSKGKASSEAKPAPAPAKPSAGFSVPVADATRPVSVSPYPFVARGAPTPTQTQTPTQTPAGSPQKALAARADTTPARPGPVGRPAPQPAPEWVEDEIREWPPGSGQEPSLEPKKPPRRLIQVNGIKRPSVPVPAESHSDDLDASTLTAAAVSPAGGDDTPSEEPSATAPNRTGGIDTKPQPSGSGWSFYQPPRQANDPDASRSDAPRSDGA